MRSLLWLLLASLLAACANMGRPEGGERDELPPKFMRSDPAPGATGVKRTRLTAIFDENIQLEDAFTKVVVSPAQKQPPSVSANGKKLTVEFRDTLLPNTTYTIDFADAIKDLNEGNILDGFALDFSTGDSIDSLRISGMVIQAENLEPAQGMLVGVYSNLSDTAFTTLPLERIART
ncbi:MAG: Ig-like domain-containing protein, partial [Muribaculaceae bacterium]|nr:Ig-like domain-containing protein [Muribaculaceae bacterium]